MQGKKKQTTSSSLQAFFEVAHSSGDFQLLVYLFFFTLAYICIYLGIIDQASSVKIARILAKFSLRVEGHKNAKRERGQCPSILTEVTWSITDLLYDIPRFHVALYLPVFVAKCILETHQHQHFCFCFHSR